MSSNFIETALDLSEVMADLRDDLLEDFEAAGKRALFEEAIQTLIAQADEVQSQEGLNALAQNIHDLVSRTEELQDLLPDELPDDDAQMGLDARTIQEGDALEAQYKKSMEFKAGINQHLVTLVPDVKPPQTNNLQSYFDKILDLLGLQRKQ